MNRLLPLLFLVGVLASPVMADLGDGLPEAGAVDSTHAYASSDMMVARLPQMLWNALVYPVGRFTIYAELTELPRRVEEVFTNDAGTFGIFPQVQLGGETNTGGGLSLFHSDLFGAGKELNAIYIYSAADRQRAELLYRDGNLRGGPWFLELHGNYLDTDSEDATINGIVEGRRDLFPDEPSLFALQQLDVTGRLGWRSNTGQLEDYSPQLSMTLQGGWSTRDLSTDIVGIPDLQGETSTSTASAIPGLGQDLSYGWLGLRLAWDDRDAKPVTSHLSHPLIYQFPGRVLLEHEGLYHSYRDIAYPEGGGLAEVSVDLARGADDVSFARLGAEVQRFHTLFWSNRVLAGRIRVDKVFPLDDGFAPYADLPTLGGGQRLKGYQRGTYRGEGALLMALEYRWPIWDTWSASLFWEEGQVFDEFGDIDPDLFGSTIGAQMILRTETAFLLGLRVAHSADETALLGFMLEQEF
ncbi:MAG: hypothetical protein HN712_16285 [Gemmatimonadetes bacterium]|nr:hypothetical protein [Gemmatimonadota bacterium]MBT6149044.1 hypothetical protein [Gemmatimonadota bacterium]MBT7861874.1 hypothetical protein [Gemmatimonadota bacterium]